MKKSAIASFLLIASSLLASDMSRASSVKAIDPSLQGDWGVFLSADFLYWYARETNLSYALTVVGVSQRPVQTFPIADPDIYSLPQTYHDMGVSWKPGVRLGIGWNTPRDDWDLNLNWTYFHSTRKDAASVPAHSTSNSTIVYVGETLLLNPWVDMAVWGSPFFDTVSAQWDLNYNSMDLELGKKFWLSPHFALRPYTGLRGAWTKTSWNLDSTFGPYTTTYFNKFYEESYDVFTNHFWGVGLLGGIQPDWHFFSNFSLFGNLDAALLWGEATNQKNLDHRVTGIESETGTFRYFELINHTTDPRRTATMQAILDLAIGLRWEERWKRNHYKTSVDLGWEQHIWFNSGSYPKNTAQGGTASSPAAPVYTRTYFDEVTNLVFGGLVAKARFDF